MWVDPREPPPAVNHVEIVAGKAAEQARLQAQSQRTTGNNNTGRGRSSRAGDSKAIRRQKQLEHLEAMLPAGSTIATSKMQIKRDDDTGDAEPSIPDPTPVAVHHKTAIHQKTAMTPELIALKNILDVDTESTAPAVAVTPQSSSKVAELELSSSQNAKTAGLQSLNQSAQQHETGDPGVNRGAPTGLTSVPTSPATPAVSLEQPGGKAGNEKPVIGRVNSQEVESHRIVKPDQPSKSEKAEPIFI